MSLQRKQPEPQSIVERIKSKPQEQEEQATPQTPLTPQEEVHRLLKKAMILQEQNFNQTEGKLQVTILIATLEEMCKVLTDFMTATQNELRTMNEQQAKTISLQNVYHSRVEGEIDRQYNKVYYVLQQKQEEVFKDYEKHIGEKAFKIEQAIEKAAAECNKAARRTEAATKNIFKAEEWRDLMYYAAPLLVLFDVVLRVVGLFGG